MLEYIKGELVDLQPDSVIVETGGLGYLVNISNDTSEFLSTFKAAKLYLHEVIKEDSHKLYGFYGKESRSVFRLLISVSGIGANTGMTILSGMTTNEVKIAISSGDDKSFVKIKGIGAKTAKRIVVELAKKVGEDDLSDVPNINHTGEMKAVAMNALVQLGFLLEDIVPIVDEILKSEEPKNSDELVMLAIKKL